MTYADPHQPPLVNVARGTLFALLAVPVGVIVWVVLWNFGFIASIVAFAVAYLAMFLYRFGSGGFVGTAGAIRITIVTVGTLLLAFFGGIVSDVLGLWSDVTGESPVSGIVSPDFWAGFQAIMAEDGVASGYLPDFGLALLFGALGCFSVIRSAFRSGKAVPVDPTAAFAAPTGPPAVPGPQGVDAAAGAPGSPAPGLPPVPPVPSVAPDAPAEPGKFDEFRDPNYRA